MTRARGAKIAAFIGFAGVALAVVAPASPPSMTTPTPSTRTHSRAALVAAGEVQPVHASLTYSALEGASTTRVVRHPGASFIKVHFAKLELSAGDWVSVSDPTGAQVHTYRGDPTKGVRRGGDAGYTVGPEGGFWALSIDGDTAIVELHSSQDAGKLPLAARRRLGVLVDRYTRGYPEQELIAREMEPESTCGRSQRRDVACYESSHPTEFALSRPVARLLLNNGTSLCTGWRVGHGNHMLTNEHCISSQADVDAAEVWFNHQRTLCNGGSVGPTTRVAGGTFLADDVTLDFALFTLDNFAAIAGFGHLDLDVRAPVLSEEIYIPQHGGGEPKHFGIESDRNVGNVCRVDHPVRNGNAPNTDLGYNCDTIGGSSGSPVLARSSHRVIGLHHFGGCPNQGVRIDRIWPRISAHLDPPPTPTPTPEPTPAPTYPVTFGPLSIGEYCRARVSPASYFGLFQASGLNCYAPGGGSGTFVGRGDQYEACRYLARTDRIMHAGRGPSDALVCEIIR